MDFHGAAKTFYAEIAATIKNGVIAWIAGASVCVESQTFTTNTTALDELIIGTTQHIKFILKTIGNGFSIDFQIMKSYLN